jgi:hypothetical protein
MEVDRNDETIKSYLERALNKLKESLIVCEDNPHILVDEDRQMKMEIKPLRRTQKDNYALEFTDFHELEPLTKKKKN